MDLRRYNIFKRFTQKVEQETTDADDTNQELIQTQDIDYKLIVKNFYDKSVYFAKKGFYKGTSVIKNLKDDILGTNIFSKYEPNNSKVKTHMLFTGGGYNYFKKVITILTIFCPTLILVYPQIYCAFIGEYLFNAAVSLEPSKRKADKDIPLSNRQKRKMAMIKEINAKQKARKEKIAKMVAGIKCALNAKKHSKDNNVNKGEDNASTVLSIPAESALC